MRALRVRAPLGARRIKVTGLYLQPAQKTGARANLEGGRPRFHGHRPLESAASFRRSNLLVTPQRVAVDNDSKCPVTGKRKYATEGEALATATHQIASNDAPKQLRPYLCPHCEAWHLTKNANHRTNPGKR